MIPKITVLITVVALLVATAVAIDQCVGPLKG